MKRHLKIIENSKNNNAALTEALQEIDRLNAKLNDIQETLEANFTSAYIEGFPPRKISYEEGNEIKVEMIGNILDC